MSRTGSILLAGALLVTAIQSTPNSAVAATPLTVKLIDGRCDDGLISATSEYWICVTNNDGIAGGELYSVPIDGSEPPTRLSPVLPGDHDAVNWIEITPDGSTVVFAQSSVDPAVVTTFGSVYKVPIEGGPVTPLFPDAANGDLIWMPELSPDGSRVVFWWWTDTEGGLYSVRVDGTNVTKIDPPVIPQLLLEPGTKISPDSNWIHYYAGFGPSAAVYTVPITGGVPVDVTDGIIGGSFQNGWITPDSQQYVLLASIDTPGVTELYSVPIGGGIISKLSRDLAPGEHVTEYVQLLPDSSKVIYLVDDAGGYGYWHHAPLAGGTSVELSMGLAYLQIANDSSRAVYWGAATSSYPFDGGDPVDLGDFGSLLISPDSSLVWLWQPIGYTDEMQLNTVPIDGGPLEPRPGAVAPLHLEGPGFKNTRMHITPNSQRFLYEADTNDDGTNELWVVPRDGAGAAYQLSPAVTTAPPMLSHFSGIAISPDSKRVVFEGDPFGTGTAIYSSLLTQPPEVADETWSIGEDAAIGSSVGTVAATDADGDQLTYSIAGDTSFDIDADTGEVTIGETLDHETTTEHQLLAEVDDGFVTSSATITIEVSDVNDNAPVAYDLDVSGPEDTAVGTALGTVTADDADDDDVTFSLAQPNSLFAVAPNGAVTLVEALDYETATSHAFVVEATDGVFTDTATVTLTVTDVDETPPSTTTTTTTVPPTTTTEPPPPPDFGDVPDTDVFHNDIIWLATKGITKGCNPPINDQYCPNDYVTRGQMAAFLHRALGSDLTPGPAVEFVDDDDSGFETDIEWLAAVGVTKGCNPPANTEFCPTSYVTRGQMAAFLDRALNLPAAPQPDLFTDDDGTLFEDQIDRLATAGITKGCNPPDNTLYCPNDRVTRAQMAAFLHRALTP